MKKTHNFKFNAFFALILAFSMLFALGCQKNLSVVDLKPQSQLDVYLTFEKSFNEAVKTLITYLQSLNQTDPASARKLYDKAAPIVEEANDLLKIWNKIVVKDPNEVYDSQRLHDILGEIKALTAKAILHMRNV